MACYRADLGLDCLLCDGSLKCELAYSAEPPNWLWPYYDNRGNPRVSAEFSAAPIRAAIADQL